MTALLTRTRVLAHEVRVRHATTGAAVPVRAAFRGRPHPGWAVRVAGGVVVVSRDTAHDLTQHPVVVVLTAAGARLRLAEPRVELALDAASLVHDFLPLPSTVQVRLHGRSGAPLTGRTVTVRAADGSEAPLPEDPDDRGTYAAQQAWPSAFRRLDVRVDGTSAGLVPYDPAVRVQRIRLAGPT